MIRDIAKIELHKLCSTSPHAILTLAVACSDYAHSHSMTRKEPGIMPRGRCSYTRLVDSAVAHASWIVQ